MSVGLRSFRKGFWKALYDQRGKGGTGMSWKCSAPQRCDFDSLEEYREAMSYYEDAADMYAEEYFERTRE